MEKFGLTINNLNSKRFKKLQRKQLTNQIISDLFLQRNSDAQLKQWVRDLCPQISQDVETYEAQFFDCVREMSIRLSRLQKSKQSRSAFYRLRHKTFEFPKEDYSASGSYQNETEISNLKKEFSLDSKDNIDLTINSIVLSEIVVHILDCPHCSEFRTLSVESLKQHVLKKHPNEARLLVLFSCPLCHARCTSMALLQDHKHIYHPKNYKSDDNDQSDSQSSQTDVKNDEKSDVKHSPLSLPENSAKNSYTFPKKNVKRKLNNKTPTIVRPLYLPRAKSKPAALPSVSNGHSINNLKKSPVNSNSNKVIVGQKRSANVRSNSTSSKDSIPVKSNSKEKCSQVSSKSVSTINFEVYQRMKELYSMGTTDPSLLKNFLQIFVERDMIIESPVCKTDQRYFPTLNTVKNVLSKNPHDFPSESLVSAPKITKLNASVQKTLSNRRGVVNIGAIPQNSVTKMNASYKRSKRGITKLHAKRLKFKSISQNICVEDSPRTPIITSVRSEKRLPSNTSESVVDDLPQNQVDMDAEEIVPIEFAPVLVEANNDFEENINVSSSKKCYTISTSLDNPKVTVQPIKIENIPDHLSDAIVVKSIKNAHLLDHGSSSSSSSSFTNGEAEHSTKQPIFGCAPESLPLGIKMEENFTPTDITPQFSFENNDLSKLTEIVPSVEMQSLKTEPISSDSPSILDIDANCCAVFAPVSTLERSASAPPLPTYHSEEESVCKLCFGEFSNYEELVQHIKEIHPLGF